MVGGSWSKEIGDGKKGGSTETRDMYGGLNSSLSNRSLFSKNTVQGVGKLADSLMGFPNVSSFNLAEPVNSLNVEVTVIPNKNEGAVNDSNNGLIDSLGNFVFDVGLYLCLFWFILWNLCLDACKLLFRKFWHI